jgi:hypothetical protein
MYHEQEGDWPGVPLTHRSVAASVVRDKDPELLIISDGWQN